jgi:hypothetical protein
MYPYGYSLLTLMIERKKLLRLYESEGKSMQETAKILGCSLHSVQYWLQKYKIKSRSRSEALYLKYNPSGDPFKLKAQFNRKDLILLGFGLGLWWGEGSKLHHGTIRLGNTDVRLIKKFVSFLVEICGVSPLKIRYGLQLFTDINPIEAKRYWMDNLQMLPEQFFPKIVVTPSGKLGTYRKKSLYGVLTVYCANIKLRKILDQLMEKYAFTKF